MPDLTLTRTRLTPTSTFGVLTRDDTGAVVAVTCEREADGWSSRKSTPERPGACIPEGIYTCARVQSPKFGDTFEVRKVPNRSAILFHSGNTFRDSHGCILLGTREEGDAIVESRIAFAKFRALQEGTLAFTLTVVNP